MSLQTLENLIAYNKKLKHWKVNFPLFNKVLTKPRVVHKCFIMFLNGVLLGKDRPFGAASDLVHRPITSKNIRILRCPASASAASSKASRIGDWRSRDMDRKDARCAVAVRAKSRGKLRSKSKGEAVE